MKRILIYRIGSIGDTVVALPALWAIKKAFPSAHITYLTNGSKKIAEQILPKEIYTEILTYPKLPKGLIDLSKLLAKRFDATFYLMNRNRDPIRIRRDRLFFKMISRKVYGISHAMKEYLPIRVRSPLKTVKPEHEYLLDCIYEEKDLDLPPRKSITPDLKLTEIEKNRVKKILKDLGCDDKILVGLMMGSQWPSKQWDTERFVEVLNRLMKEKDVFPVIFGGKNEKDVNDKVLSRLIRGINIAGMFDLRTDAAILEQCSLYLGTDTGTMHLAAAVGVPCVAIFSAIDYPGRWHPFGNHHKIIRKTVPCEGCLSAFCQTKSHECMNKINVEEVYTACLEVLNNHGA
jgi:ADP-heptose:LPS heptosyltransferase